MRYKTVTRFLSASMIKAIGNDWALNIKSVIVFGRVRFVEDQDTINQICTNMCDKFTDDKEYAKVELSKCGSSVLCLELNPEHITGKLVNES